MDDLSLELSEKLSRLQWLLHKQKMQEHLHGTLSDTTRGQGRIIAILKMQDEISTKDLSFLLGIRTSSLNETLSKLEKNGFITREPSPEDKRVMLIKLTEKGKNEEQPEDSLNDIFSCLNAKEKESFADFLDRVIEALEKKTGESENPIPEKMEEKLRDKMGDEKFEQWIMNFGDFKRIHHLKHMKHGGHFHKHFWKRDD